VPVAYPYAVALVGNNAAITDVEILNSWNGISAVAAHRHYIARIQVAPLTGAASRLLITSLVACEAAPLLRAIGMGGGNMSWLCVCVCVCVCVCWGFSRTAGFSVSAGAAHERGRLC
jgi:hypothetical protein